MAKKAAKKRVPAHVAGSDSKPPELEPWRVFVAELLRNDLDRSKAYLIAYPDCSPQNARGNAFRLLQKDYVQAAIREELDAYLEEVGIDTTLTLRELAALAYSNLGDVVSWDRDGVFIKPSAELSRQVMAGVKKIECKRREIPMGEDTETMILETTWKIEMHDKVGAIDKLMRYLKLLGATDDEGAGGGDTHYHVYLPGTMDRAEWLRKFAAPPALPEGQDLSALPPARNGNGNGKKSA